MQYYDGALYVSGTYTSSKSESLPVIYKVNVDGSGYKDVFHPRTSIYSFAIHRGALYVTYTDFTKSAGEYTDEEELETLGYGVLAYDMGNLSRPPRKVVEETGCWGQVNTLIGFGNYLFIAAVVATQEYGETGKLSSRQWSYNRLTKEIRAF